jgi:acetyl esterase/lipase
MDGYLPAGRNTQTRTIIIVHGGGWIAGDKNDYSDWALGLSDKGYAVFNINYRLCDGSATWRDQIEDMGRAVDCIRDLSGTMIFSRNKIALMGLSAGGHLALLYTHRYDTAHKIDTVISLAGPTDITSSALHDMLILKYFDLDTVFTSDEDKHTSSPLEAVGSTPTLLFHGQVDDTVPYQQSQAMYNALVSHGTVTALYLYSDTDHSVITNAADPSVNHGMEVNNIIMGWIDTYAD